MEFVVRNKTSNIQNIKETASKKLQYADKRAEDNQISIYYTKQHDFVPPCLLTPPACDPKEINLSSILKGVTILKMNIEEQGSLPGELLERIHRCFLCRSLFSTHDV